jgi:ribosome-associated protein
MEETQERTLSRDTVTLQVAPKPTNFSELDEPAQLALHCAADKKATEIVVLDLRGIASFTEFFIIASGTNQRQVQAIADEINDRLKKDLRMRAVRIEGYNSAEWVLLDYGDFIVHVFNGESRDHYDLARLWRDAARVELPPELTADA